VNKECEQANLLLNVFLNQKLNVYCLKTL